jgi:hypothetical protein
MLVQFFNPIHRPVVLLNLTLRSPEIFAPAKIPVAAGKKTANTEKKLSPFLKFGERVSTNIGPEKQWFR